MFVCLGAPLCMYPLVGVGNVGMVLNFYALIGSVVLLSLPYRAYGAVLTLPCWRGCGIVILLCL